ncbi:interferon-induced protein with tetratricopeptide repeats 1-like [Orycteropus afer afer]|uniref:Interferon-induced protein with tetratricopeptide repeats 1-like n=1 Tax=Orycteropus afer afer TaxID=1230840 RepID=A0A8B7A2R7_ORYAF|nr:interferon-induced protein with tetratricopeptide repeats 1-like [Orycteropus afer afer]
MCLPIHNTDYISGESRKLSTAERCQFTATMSTSTDELKERLEQLRCHFTWALLIEDSEIPDLESRILEEIEFLDIKHKVGIHNLLAYMKHLKGQNEETLESLKKTEELIQQEHADQSDLRSLVTWGNYAWVYYHMGRLTEAQTYLDKVENTCKKLGSPFCYRMECPEMDCEKGWALLKCGGQNYEQAKACFEKALEVDPENPEFNTGYAITIYRLDGFTMETDRNGISLEPLRKAVRLNPEDVYLTVLLALKLQDVGQETEGEKYIEEALTSMSSQIYVFRYAAKFYRRQGSLDKALSLLKKVLKATPTSAFLHHQIGLCYRTQVIQMKTATNRQPRRQDRETHDRIKSAIYHLEYAVKQKPTFDVAYAHLASIYIEIGDYRKAEDTFEKALSLKSLEESKMQKLHFHYGRFQEFQKKSEVNAIIHYLKAIKIEKASAVRDKAINSLGKLALRRFQRNASDVESLSLLGFIYKLKGEMNEALEHYERALKLATGLKL